MRQCDGRNGSTWALSASWKTSSSNHLGSMNEINASCGSDLPIEASNIFKSSRGIDLGKEEKSFRDSRYEEAKVRRGLFQVGEQACCFDGHILPPPPLQESPSAISSRQLMIGPYIARIPLSVASRATQRVAQNIGTDAGIMSSSLAALCNISVLLFGDLVDLYA